MTSQGSSSSNGGGGGGGGGGKSKGQKKAAARQRKAERLRLEAEAETAEAAEAEAAVAAAEAAERDAAEAPPAAEEWDLRATVGGGGGGGGDDGPTERWAALPAAPADAAEAKRRHKALVAQLKQRLADEGVDADNAALSLARFRDASAGFVRGERARAEAAAVTGAAAGATGAADALLQNFLGEFGRVGAAPLLLELCALLPSPRLIVELSVALQRLWGMEPGSPLGSPVAKTSPRLSPVAAPPAAASWATNSRLAAAARMAEMLDADAAAAARTAAKYGR